MNYFICGFSGAGKSYLLESLKELIELELIDLDQYIFQQFGQGHDGLGDYIRDVGFKQFRLEEKKALSVLAKKGGILISLGGGALDTKAELILKDFNGLWLNTDFETCYSRIKDDINRPLSEKSYDELKELYLSRKLVYSKYSEVSNAKEVAVLVKESD